jgi:hypothetical protein
MPVSEVAGFVQERSLDMVAEFEALCASVVDLEVKRVITLMGNLGAKFDAALFGKTSKPYIDTAVRSGLFVGAELSLDEATNILRRRLAEHPAEPK